MAWRLEEHVIRGELDNRIHDRVCGRIWLEGIPEPLLLELEGNCQSDLAGCLLTFENRTPAPIRTQPPVARQRGHVGNITASRKVLVPDVPADEFIRLQKAGLPAPQHLANSLYLEWFSDLSGHIVIESANFELQVSPPEWRLPSTRNAEPMQISGEVVAESLERASELLSESTVEGLESRPWDEFRHEQALRESDALTDKFGKLLDKYRHHPDRDRIIAQEMGWDWMDDIESEERTEQEYSESDLVEDADDQLPARPTPDPAREGIDWIRTPSGEIRHPLHQRAWELSAGLHHFCGEQGLHKQLDPGLVNLLSQANLLTSKLAGALEDLAEGTNLYEPGFVVALLKRALTILNRVLANLKTPGRKSLLPREMITKYRVEVLSIREEMLALIQQFRKKVS